VLARPAAGISGRGTHNGFLAARDRPHGVPGVGARPDDWSTWYPLPNT